VQLQIRGQKPEVCDATKADEQPVVGSTINNQIQ